MASIDLTLNGIKIPALDGYTPPFGTKKVSGGLTTQEVNDNVIAPFVKERPIVITENSSTGSVEYNASLVINSANAVLTLGSGTYVGCTVKVIAATAGSVSYNSGTTDTLAAGQKAFYTWNGSGWNYKITGTGATVDLNIDTTKITKANDYSAQFTVVDGICYVRLWGLTPDATIVGQSQYQVATNLPPCGYNKIAYYIGAYSDLSKTTLFEVWSGSNILRATFRHNVAHYLTLEYRVADNWHP